MIRLLLAVCAVCCIMPIHADMRVELLDRHERVTNLIFQGDWVRGNSHRSDYTYTLMNLREQRIYLVDMGDKKITDATGVFFNGKPRPHSVVEIGAGPEIAGRDTLEYQISDSSGEKCARIFIIPNPAEAELKSMQRLLAQIKIDPESLMPVLGTLAKGVIPECVRAEMDSLGELSQRGLIAMRINQEGITTLRIRHIKPNPNATAACMLTLPKHYANESPAAYSVKSMTRRLFGGREKLEQALTDHCP